MRNREKKQAERQIDKESERQRDKTSRDRETKRVTERQTKRVTERQTKRVRDRQRGIETERRNKQTEKLSSRWGLEASTRSEKERETKLIHSS